MKGWYLNMKKTESINNIKLDYFNGHYFERDNQNRTTNRRYEPRRRFGC